MPKSNASTIRKPASSVTESLAGKYPELLAEWDYEKNPFSPEEPVPGSTVMAHWICLKGHPYEKQIAKRVLGRACPYCRKSKPLLFSGFNDLETLYPQLAKQWHPTKNAKTPLCTRASESTYHSWWQCELEHDWQATVFNRTRNGSGCPECSNKTSKGELELLDFIRALGLEAKYTDRTVIAPYELDILIPSLKLALEFNGIYWHSDEMVQKRSGMSSNEYHALKLKKTHDAGFRLAFIWQDDWVLRRNEIENAILETIAGNEVSTSLTILEKPYSLNILKELQKAR